MSEFKIGQRVKVISGEAGNIGEFAYVVNIEDGWYMVSPVLNGPMYAYMFSEDELAPLDTAAPPATDAQPVGGVIDIDITDLDIAEAELSIAKQQIAALKSEVLTLRAANDVNAQRGNEFETEVRRFESVLKFAKAELSKIPAPITQTHYATEIINSVWASVAEALDAKPAPADAGGSGSEEPFARIRDLKAALEPFAEAWLQVPFGLRSVLRIWNGRTGEESGYNAIGLGTDDLEAAHVAWANSPKAEKPAE